MVTSTLSGRIKGELLKQKSRETGERPKADPHDYVKYSGNADLEENAPIFGRPKSHFRHFGHKHYRRYSLTKINQDIKIFRKSL